MTIASSRRHFAIRASIAKRHANDNEVSFCGHRIVVNDENATLVEIVRLADASAAYEAAAMGRALPTARIAA